MSIVDNLKVFFIFEHHMEEDTDVMWEPDSV